jgi:hypothetical protein
VPIAVPIAEAAVPIIVNTIKPNKGPQLPKFEGTVINATIAQITVRAKGDDIAIQTFPLTQEASAKMLQIIDKGGYQYGDKVTVFFDPDSKESAQGQRQTLESQLISGAGDVSLLLLPASFIPTILASSQSKSGNSSRRILFRRKFHAARHASCPMPDTCIPGHISRSRFRPRHHPQPRCCSRRSPLSLRRGSGHQFLRSMAYTAR